MKSNNPVFARSDEFNGRAAQPGTQSGYTDPSQWQVSQPGGLDSSGGYGAPTGQAPYGTTVEARMTVDSVVQKTAMTLGLVAISAAVVWFMLGDVAADQSKMMTAGSLATGGAIFGFVLAMVNSFKKVISPALVLVYALVEGAFIGAFSKIIATWVGDPGIVAQAVLGTIAAFAGTLFVYKFFNIQVTDKFRRGVTAVLFGFVAVLLLNFVLSFFGADFGLRDMNNPGLSLIVSGIAVILGVLCLVLDFDYVETGVRAGLPERESWRAAFGLTVTLIWLYIEILRILAILRGGD